MGLCDFDPVTNTIWRGDRLTVFAHRSQVQLNGFANSLLRFFDCLPGGDAAWQVWHVC